MSSVLLVEAVGNICSQKKRPEEKSKSGLKTLPQLDFQWNITIVFFYNSNMSSVRVTQ